MREAALAQAETRGLDAALVWAAGEGWHPGVVGIVAARLKEAANRPAVVIGFDGDEGKGSGRSVSGIDLGAAVQRLAAEGLLEQGGGHRMAAGLSLSRDQLAPAMARLTDLLARQGADRIGPRDLDRRAADAGRGDAGPDRRDRGRRSVRRQRPGAAFRLSRDGDPPGPEDRRKPPQDQLWRYRRPGAGSGRLRRLRRPDGRGAGTATAGPGSIWRAASRATAGTAGPSRNSAWKTPPPLPDGAPRDRPKIRLPSWRGFPRYGRTLRFGPFVYRLGHQVFNLVRGVRLPYGLPANFLNSLMSTGVLRPPGGSRRAMRWPPGRRQSRPRGRRVSRRRARCRHR